MLAGEKVPINTGTFANDMTSFSSKDDVLTLLVHLGYLTYDSEKETVAIPNKEVSQEYINAISTMGWHEVMDAVQASRKLLQALWNMDADTVAQGIEQAHQEISILLYHKSCSLFCKGILHDYPRTAHRKRLCRYLLYSKKIICG